MKRFIEQHTDCYFTKSRESAIHAELNPVCIWQVFQREDAVFCGLNRVVEMLTAYGRPSLSGLEIYSVPEGYRLKPNETAMLIKGRFQDLVQFETVYLGVLARMTKVATNVRAAFDLVNGKPILFFPARFDVPETQWYDGYAAAVGGAFGCATPESAEGFADAWKSGAAGIRPCVTTAVGTMPHALIAAFRGDTAAATVAFAQSHPNEEVWSLVDFHNDCGRTAVEVARAMQDKGLKLTGVRLDTSGSLMDESVKGCQIADQYRYGVCPQLVANVRLALDKAGFQNVKIAVSGGFTPEKIKMFEGAKLPVDVYAVGEGFLKGFRSFTSDIVLQYDGNKLIPCSKVGREYKPNPNLTRVYGEGPILALTTIA